MIRTGILFICEGFREKNFPEKKLSWEENQSKRLKNGQEAAQVLKMMRAFEDDAECPSHTNQIDSGMNVSRNAAGI